MITSTWVNHTALALSFAIPALWQQPASAKTAQDVVPATTPAVDGQYTEVTVTDRQETEMGDIIVTANKRSESIQRVPVSVLAVAPRTLTETGVVSTVQLQQIVPALSFSPSGEAKLNSFYVRGVGTYALSAAVESSVGIAIDGVPLARVGGSISDLVDVERVEVLKGPQGMLFGKNATAGLVGLVTRKPELGVTNGQAHLSYGSYEELNADATVNLALGSDAALRVTGWRFSHDGIVKGLNGRDYLDKNSYGIRAAVSVEPKPGVTLTLIGQFDGRKEHGTAFTYREFNNTPPFGSIVEAHERSLGIVPSSDNLVADIGPAAPRAFGRNWYLTGLADVVLGNGLTLSSATSYRKVVSKGQQDPFLSSSPLIRLNEVSDVERYNQITQELRIASPTDHPFSFVAGLFFYDFNITDVQGQRFFGVPVPGSSNYGRRNTIRNSLRNVAVFGEATYRITPALRIIAGLRQSHDRVTGFFDRALLGTDTGVIPASVPIFSFTPKPVKYNATSYRFGAQLDLARDIMVYATASRGYKAPGFNLTQSLTPASIVNDAGVEAEIAKSYEVGIKSQFFDRRLTANITIFRSTFSNFQTTVGLPVSPPIFVIQNAGELKSSGVEVDLSARPLAGLSLGLNGAYINARYTDFDSAACYPLQPTLPAGSPLTPGFCVGGLQSLDGFPLAQSPKWSFNASARYETAVGGEMKAFVGGNYAYRSKTFYEANRNPKESQGGYGFLNVTIGMGHVDDAWSIALYARNLLDKNFVSRVRGNFNSYYQLPAYEGRRRLGVQLSGKF